MRILVFNQFYATDSEPGISRFNVFAREWVKKGASVTVISGAVNYMTGKRVGPCRLWRRIKDKNGVDVIRVYSSMLGYKTLIGRALAYITFIKASLLAGLLIEKHDVIVGSSPPITVAFVAALVGKIRNIPFVMEVRDPWPDEAIELGFLKNRLLINLSYWLEEWLYDRAERFVVNSPGLKLFLEEKSVKKPIAVVPNPVNKAPVGNSENNGAFSIVYVGGMGIVYDFDTLIDAVHELESEGVVCAIVGSGRQRDHIASRLKDEHISNITLYPPVAQREAWDIVSSADCAVAVLKDIRSLRYVYASKLFEYMALGRPIALAMEGVSRELVCEDAKAGICVHPGDKEALKNAIRRIEGDPEFARALGKRGRKYVEEYFKPEDLAEKMYKTICAE